MGQVSNCCTGNSLVPIDARQPLQTHWSLLHPNCDVIVTFLICVKGQQNYEDRTLPKIVIFIYLYKLPCVKDIYVLAGGVSVECHQCTGCVCSSEGRCVSTATAAVV